MFRAAYRSSSEAPNCICSLWYIYQCGDRSLCRLCGNWITYLNCYYWSTLTVEITDPVPTQPGQLPVTTSVYKPEAVNTVWSSWWWAVCRLKYVEPSITFGVINSIRRLHLVGYFFWFIGYNLVSKKIKVKTIFARKFWFTHLITIFNQDCRLNSNTKYAVERNSSTFSVCVHNVSLTLIVL
jgi:hypothetical protein